MNQISILWEGTRGNFFFLQFDTNKEKKGKRKEDLRGKKLLLIMGYWWFEKKKLYGNAFFKNSYEIIFL